MQGDAGNPSIALRLQPLSAYFNQLSTQIFSVLAFAVRLARLRSYRDVLFFMSFAMALWAAFLAHLGRDRMGK